MPVEERKRDLTSVEQEYDALYREAPVRDEDRAYVFHVRNILEQKPEASRFLDVACGAGYFLRELRDLAGSGAVLAGTDLSSVALDLARRECPEAAYRQAAAEELPFEDASFDAVSCLGSMEHFMDIPRAVREMKRVAKPDALFYIMVPNIFWYKDIFSVVFRGTRVTRNQTHERFASPGEWQEILRASGLNVIRTQKYNGIARSALKQAVKDAVIPLKFSYHFIFYCRK